MVASGVVSLATQWFSSLHCAWGWSLLTSQRDARIALTRAWHLQGHVKAMRSCMAGTSRAATSTSTATSARRAAGGSAHPTAAAARSPCTTLWPSSACSSPSAVTGLCGSLASRSSASCTPAARRLHPRRPGPAATALPPAPTSVRTHPLPCLYSGYKLLELPFESSNTTAAARRMFQLMPQ